jgi:rSAM/selenodomain-associated transferase 1
VIIGVEVDVELAVFSKAPQAGKAKTRLIPQLGSRAAARLHRQLTLITLNLAQAFRPGQTTLWCAPDCGHRFFRAVLTRYKVTLLAQRGADLGARMHHAFVTQGGPLLLIGSDCPALRQEHLESAAQVLKSGHDAVFIPAEDGGYVLVGLQQANAGVFANIDWGSDQVIRQTRERLTALGLRWQELETLWDVDRPEDLERFRSMAGGTHLNTVTAANKKILRLK